VLSLVAGALWQELQLGNYLGCNCPPYWLPEKTLYLLVKHKDFQQLFHVCMHGIDSNFNEQKAPIQRKGDNIFRTMHHAN
jgi:hypothetical protein